MDIKLLDTCLSIESLNGDELDQLVILPAGVVRLYEMDPLLVDKEAASAIIMAFDDQGVKVPIDFEHAAIRKAERGEPAPAAAWITSLSWDPKRGLIADVEWTKDAKKMVLAGQYKYLSPVVYTDPATRRPLLLHSAALTNRPRIKDQTELLSVAASVTLTGVVFEKENMMAKAGKITTAASAVVGSEWVQKVKGGKLQRVAMQVEEGAEEGAEEEAAAMPEEVAGIIDTFKELLAAWDIVLADEASAVDVLNAVGELLMRLYEETAAAEDAVPVEEIAEEVTEVAASAGVKTDKVAASVSAVMTETALCDRLGLPRGTTLKKILSKVDAMKGHIGYVPQKQFNELSVRLGTIEKERAEKNVDAELEKYVTLQKLNPFDAERMAWARRSASQDPEGFRLMMSDAPVIIDPGKMVPTLPVTDEGKSGRQQVIASSVAQYQEEGMEAMCGLSAWVNGDLKESGQTSLTEDELKRIAA